MILSVPHTGTRFLAQLTGYDHMHSYEYKTPQQVMSDNGGEVLISPLRDPRKVYGTWSARYKDGNSWVMDPSHPKSMESAWKGLAALDKELDIIYIPVDSPGRSLQLRLLSDKMGVPLRTNWDPVAQFRPGRERPEPPARDLSWIYELPMVRQWYHE